MNVPMRVADTTASIHIAEESREIIEASWHHNESFRALVDRVAKIPNISNCTDKIAVINFFGDAFLNQFRLAAVYEQSIMRSFVHQFMSETMVQFAFFLKPQFLRILRNGHNWNETLKPIGDASLPKRCLITISSTANPRMPVGAVAYPEGTRPELYRSGAVGIR